MLNTRLTPKLKRNENANENENETECVKYTCTACTRRADQNNTTEYYVTNIDFCANDSTKVCNFFVCLTLLHVADAG